MFENYSYKNISFTVYINGETIYFLFSWIDSKRFEDLKWDFFGGSSKQRDNI